MAQDGCKMNDEEKYKLRKEGAYAVLQWLDIRSQYINSSINEHLSQLSADLDHSSLLDRLCQGKEPFDVPPPRAMSYPNYDLLENDECFPLEVWESKGDDWGMGCVVLGIDQALWKVVEKRGEDDWLVKYEIGHCLNEGGSPRWSKTTWRVYKIGSRTDIREGILKHLWKIEKHE